MNLISSASVFSFFTLISRVLGYLRDILIAIFLGASIYADAFFVAFRLPNTFRRLFAEGTFNAAFIPNYTSARIESKKNGKKFALILEDSNGLQKGDTIMVGNTTLITDRIGSYIPGGDYNVKKTGNKKYKIN